MLLAFEDEVAEVVDDADVGRVEPVDQAQRGGSCSTASAGGARMRITLADAQTGGAPATATAGVATAVAQVEPPPSAMPSASAVSPYAAARSSVSVV